MSVPRLAAVGASLALSLATFGLTASAPTTAADAGIQATVSTATVSRVVNGNARVGPDVKARVAIAIDELGSVPDPSARSLITHRTDSIGVVILESTDRLCGDPFFGLEEAGEYRAHTAAAAMQALLARRPDLDAVFVASDSMAIAAMQAIKDSERRVPEDVAVIGFDDLPTAQQSQPSLSTVRQPIASMGREMVRLVIQQIEAPGSAANNVQFATELVLRGSTGDLDDPGPTGAGPAGHRG